MLRGVALCQALRQTGILGHRQIERGPQRLVLVVAQRQLIARRSKLVLELDDPCIRRLELLVEYLFRGRLLGQAPFKPGGPGAGQFELIGELDVSAVRCRVEVRRLQDADGKVDVVVLWAVVGVDGRRRQIPLGWIGRFSDLGQFTGCFESGPVVGVLTVAVVVVGAGVVAVAVMFSVVAPPLGASTMPCALVLEPPQAARPTQIAAAARAVITGLMFIAERG